RDAQDRRPLAPRNRRAPGRRRTHGLAISRAGHDRSRRSFLQRSQRQRGRAVSEQASAKDARAAAGQWLERREFGPWDAADQKALAASPSHMVEFLRVEQVWKRADRLRALNRPMREAKPAPQKTPLSFIPKLAAAFAMVAAVGIGVGAYVLN